MNAFEIGKNFLQHHGVKGQKWGVRRSRKQLAKAAGKPIKDMSDEELRAVVNRMNLEQQYSRLTTGRNQRNLAATGAAFIGSVALNVARTQLQNAANAQVSRALNSRK